MKSSKFLARKRRSLKSKHVINHSNRPRMVVFRSINHIYAQIVKPSQSGDLVLAQASSVDKSLSKELDGNKVSQAVKVGKLLAKRAREKDIAEIAFDRNGYKYHGRVKALADSAREAGLIF